MHDRRRCLFPPWIPRGGYSLLVLGLLVLMVLPSCRGGQEPPPPPPPPPPALPVTDLDVGLSAAETMAWRSISEGSDLIPVDILRALVDVRTDRLFIDSLDHYGFLPRDAGPGNPYGLPVGWVIAVPEYSLLKLDYVGVNCSACHSGQIEYAGQALRIDGAPNMADIEEFALVARDSVVEMLKDPLEVFHFIVRLVELEPPAGADPRDTFGGQLSAEAREFLRGCAEAASNDKPEPEDVLAQEMGKAFTEMLTRTEPTPVDEAVETLVKGLELIEGVGEKIRQIYDFVRKYEALLKNRISLAVLAIEAIETSTTAGPGRDDPWNLVRNVLFKTPAKLNSPTSIPHLYRGQEFVWYHADGNTNSVMDRDITQAVALGAFVDAETNQSTLLPRQIWALEDLMGKLTPPAWPESVFGAIDTAKAERGKEIFERKMPAPGGGEFSCHDCHQALNGKLIALAAVGTDPNRAESFLEPQDGKPYWEAIPEAVDKIEAFVFEKAGITPEEARQHEYQYPPEWRGTGEYISRELIGIWSTAPYLHNASVPTLYHLLRPAQRPASFAVGHRDYDPKKVGYTTDVAEPIFTFDTTKNGNSNAGHEYGTDLEESERQDLIEYLKTL